MITRTRTAAAVPRPRGRRPAAAELDMRERLLASATQLFGEQGIAATTMAQIAEAAGVTSAMVHYYFTNREKLLDAVVDERIARSIAFVWESVDSAEGDLAQDPHALVEELVSRLFDVTSRMPWLPPLWLREIVNEGGLLRERMLKRLPIAQLQRFAARVSEAQRDGSVNAELEAPLLFISILALVMLPLATSKIWQSSPGFPQIEREALHRHVSALLSAALRPAPQDKRAQRAAGRTTSRKGDAS
ncbi:TetR/AcrR family transcriptional regulator [Paraburkholderia guartelaensis]|uniref:TetR/AcrR family transcriptional regulator n=1 Tax=Paraburkholderia guartelaensis TaxID=2546446 RepID=UPI002AB6E5D3|nr:TetR/AcrR family transcriptional regulator [Paraburkholderia guartelaensis]